jgi:CheY-like chemotaxis protein
MKQPVAGIDVMDTRGDHGLIRSSPLTSVLVVDDDPAILRLLTMLLGVEGYSVQTAERGEQAVEAIKTDPPDLVILDLGLPDMDGCAVSALARENGYRNPFLVLSARVNGSSDSAGIQADAFLPKPFDRPPSTRSVPFNAYVLVHGVNQAPHPNASKAVRK